MKYMTLNICVFLLTLLGSGNSITENKIVQRFYSDESVFIKLENTTTRFDYYYWEEQCRELGDGFFPAVFHSQGEFKFIRRFVSEKWILKTFWVGGTTNGGGPRNSIELFEYLPTPSGQRGVFINTDWASYERPSVMFALRARTLTDGLKSVLCRTDGMSFQSNNAMYQKLVSSTPQNRDYWIDKCARIGNGWIPVILNSETELNLILEKIGELRNNQSFWIAGSARTTGDIDFLHYFQYELGTGTYPVYVASDNGNFQLTAGSDSLQLHGILCENDGMLYESETSYYRRRMSALSFNYVPWSERCLDLGDGWALAIVNDTTELEFIKSQERLSTDNRNYWIGGLAYETVGENQVWLLSTWRNGQGWTNNPSVLVLRKRWDTVYGILCEKAKN